MDELESQIRQVLGDPTQMAQIMSLAQSLMGGEGAPAPAPPRPEGLGAGPAAPGVDAPGQTERQALLAALRPYLSDERRRRLDRALRISSMAQLAKRALGSLGGTEHA